MPEGPFIVILKEEVQSFKGKKILRVVGNAKIDLSRLDQQAIIDFKSWGKHFLICFENFFVKIHLLMFGSYRVNEKREIPSRLGLIFKNGELYFYNCFVKIIEGNPDDVYDWEKDIMSGTWNPDKALNSLQTLKNTMVCDALLDQDIFSGIGNIIKNEVLFLEQIHPTTLVENLSEKKLKKLISTTRDYSFKFYRWKKAYVLRKHWLAHRCTICTNCGSKLILQHMGKRNRRTFFCEYCQKLST